MDSILLETCAREFERGIKRLFETAPRIPGTGMAEIPVVGGVFLTWADHSFLLPQVYRALLAREQFTQEAPGWPILPLRSEDCDELKNADCPRCKLVGFYGGSLRHAVWEGHPPFARYASGLMAYEHAPIEVRTDCELKCKFPPRELEGLDQWLRWCTPEQVALYRDNAALIARMEAREARIGAD